MILLERVEKNVYTLVIAQSPNVDEIYNTILVVLVRSRTEQFRIDTISDYSEFILGNPVISEVWFLRRVHEHNLVISLACE